jgi:hypothetical protein
MKRATAILSLGYWFSAYTLGLLLHPYKTVREIVRRPTFSPLVAVPAVTWMLGWMAGMVGLRFGDGVLRLVGVVPTPEWLVRGLVFVFWWGTYFLGWWQLLLAYLWVRFLLAWRE